MSGSSGPQPPDLIEPGILTLGACAVSGPPVHSIDEQGIHSGYEGELAQALAQEMGVSVRWKIFDWAELYPSLDSHRIDAVLYNQAILPARREQVDFTRPYGLFNDSVLTMAGSDIETPADLAGTKIAAMTGATSMTLALAFENVEIVEFDLGAEGFEAMLAALRNGKVVAALDDEIFLGPFEQKGYRIAFTVRTKNPYGVACRRNSTLVRTLDEALKALIERGELERIWREQIPGHGFEPPEPQPEHSVEHLRLVLAKQFA